MWIRTQNKEQLIKVVKVSISGVLGGKNKAMIFGHFDGASFLEGNNIELGAYKTKEDALEELDKLQEFISQNPNGVYQMN